MTQQDADDVFALKNAVRECNDFGLFMDADAAMTRLRVRLDALTTVERERDEARQAFASLTREIDVARAERDEAQAHYARVREWGEGLMREMRELREKEKLATRRAKDAETWAAGMKANWDEHVRAFSEVAEKATTELVHVRADLQGAKDTTRLQRERIDALERELDDTRIRLEMAERREGAMRWASE